ncbi:hypothetical protein CBL_13766 [Carabus blaptoides fortunei]
MEGWICEENGATRYITKHELYARSRRVDYQATFGNREQGLLSNTDADAEAKRRLLLNRRLNTESSLAIRRSDQRCVSTSRCDETPNSIDLKTNLTNTINENCLLTVQDG